MVFNYNQKSEYQEKIMQILNLIQGIIFSFVCIDIPIIVKQEMLNTPIAFFLNLFVFFLIGWWFYVPSSLFLSEFFFKIPVSNSNIDISKYIVSSKKDVKLNINNEVL